VTCHWNVTRRASGDAENCSWKHGKERLGLRLEEAIILYTGEHAYTHDDWITILPLDRLWAST
jgi:hypothetical protein